MSVIREGGVALPRRWVIGFAAAAVEHADWFLEGAKEIGERLLARFIRGADARRSWAVRAGQRSLPFPMPRVFPTLPGLRLRREDTGAPLQGADYRWIATRAPSTR